MAVIRVMADYESFPLWRRDANGTTNVDPASLPISADLARHLEDWAAEHDGTLDRGDPLASGFTDPAAEAAFHARGKELAGRLAGELPATSPSSTSMAAMPVPTPFFDAPEVSVKE